MNGPPPYLRDLLIEQIAQAASRIIILSKKIFCALHKTHIAMHNKQSYLRPVQGMLHLA
jgi:hypothetical protein